MRYSLASFYTEAEKRSELTLDRHCELKVKHVIASASEARHCEERSDEAIQRPFLASHKATGLLRRYAPRNDGFTLSSQ